MICPICSIDASVSILELNCGNFDHSVLYETATILTCTSCGHIFNQLSEEDRYNIIEYYNTEYSQTNLTSPNKQGDRPGSNSINSNRRYSDLYNLIAPYLQNSMHILDIGCAMGGFLSFLSDRSYTNLYGIDLSDPYIEVAKSNPKLNIKKGFAENIPYDNNQFDFILSDQVVEHLFDPNSIFIEAKRTLQEDGFLCISIPNAYEYEQTSFFDYYWFLLREHVQHFDHLHLRSLAEKHGFKLITSMLTYNDMISPLTILPNLTILFQYTNEYYPVFRDYCLAAITKHYIESSHKQTEEKIEKLSLLANSGEHVYVYGMSREFLYLYKNTPLSNCNTTLIDDTLYRQQYCTVEGKKINPSSILVNAKDKVIITAIGHIPTLKKKLEEFNFKGDIIEL